MRASRSGDWARPGDTALARNKNVEVTRIAGTRIYSSVCTCGYGCDRPAFCDELFPADDPGLVAIEFHAAEPAALVEIADRIGLQLGLLRHRVLAEFFGPAGRAIAEIVGAVVVPPGTFIVGGAIKHLEMDAGMFEPDAAELHEVIRLEPDRKPAVIERHVAEIADADAGHLQAVLVGIERAERFAKHLADTVAAVGPRGDVGSDAVMAWIEADRVVGRREHNALDALFVGRLEQIVAADDVGLMDLVPGAFDRIATEMQDAVDAVADRLDLGEIGKVGFLEFFAAGKAGRRVEVAEHEVRIDRRQHFSQRCSNSACGAGHQYAWHLFPL